MSFDRKGKVILEHYREVILKDEFDEYDVLGLLIFIREHLEDEKYPLIKDFAHLIAHRGRNRGKVMEAIRGAIENNYQTIPGSQRIKGFPGMNTEAWKNEWVELGRRFNFNFTEERLIDITVCVFSLAQYTEYDDGCHKGRIELFQDYNYEYNYREIALATTENTERSLYVNFAKIGPISYCKELQGWHFESPVETIRENNKLRLKDENEFII